MSECPLRPLNGFVILERFKKEEMTPGGLIRPQAQQVAIDKGRIVAIGDPRESDLRTIPLPNVKVGDVVHFAAAAGVEIESGDTVYFSLPAQNIICVEKQ